MSKEQVAELVAPHPDTLRFVTSWFERSGVSSPVTMTYSGGYLMIPDVPVSHANDLLGASYQFCLLFSLHWVGVSFEHLQVD